MELTRNDNYWRAKPKLDKIIRREFKDTTTALLAFEAGEVDSPTSPPTRSSARTSPNGTVLPGPSGVDLDIVLNPLKNKDFADKRVRQAILYAIDRKSILQNIYHIPDPTLLELPVPRSDLNPPDVAQVRLRPGEGQGPAGGGRRRSVQVGRARLRHLLRGPGLASTR